MEKSQVIEECTTSESSWTKYLLSPVNSSHVEEEDHAGEAGLNRHPRDAEEDDDGDNDGDHGYNEEDDDSLVSDASSGLSRRGRYGRKNDGRREKGSEGAVEEGGDGSGNESCGECSRSDGRVTASGKEAKEERRRCGGIGWEESSNASSYYASHATKKTSK